MQMIYWITTTISTVGYGDFSPTTVPSRQHGFHKHHKNQLWFLILKSVPFSKTRVWAKHFEDYSGCRIIHIVVIQKDFGGSSIAVKQCVL